VIDMTREKAQEELYSYVYDDSLESGHLTADLITKIYDDFESRTCDNCKWLTDLGFCVNLKSIGNGKDRFEDSIKSDIGCNKFERKE